MTFSGGIFPTQGSNLDLLHCRWFLYCLSHQGSSQTEGEVKTEFCGNHGTNQKELRARGFYFIYLSKLGPRGLLLSGFNT